MRPKPNVAEVMNIIGEVEGKNCIVIDDMVDTAGSITAASVALKKAGAKRIFVCCTHPLLSGDATKRIDDSPIEELICTNTVELPDNKKSPKITQLSIASLLGQGIINIIDDQGVSTLFR